MKTRNKVAVSVIVAASFTIGSVGAASAASAADVPSVEIIVSSNETVGQVIESVKDEYGADVSSRVFDQMADLAGDGTPTLITGLDTLPTATTEGLLRDSADALASGVSLPAEVQTLPVEPVLNASEEPSASTSNYSGAFAVTTVDDEDGTVESGGGSTDPGGNDNVPEGSGTAGPTATSYTQRNFIHRLITSTSGPQETDRIELKWVTNPGAVSSRIDYTYTYPKSTGFFRSVAVDSYSFTGTSTSWGDHVQKFNLSPGSWSSTIYNNPKANGKTLHHQADLVAKNAKGASYVDHQYTPNATCNKTNNVCRYKSSQGSTGV